MVATGVRWVACVAAIAAMLVSPYAAVAETLESALAQAYRNNPTLNAQRAALRATDESVPQALANYRPRVTGTWDNGYQHFESISTAGGAFTQTNTNISPRGGNIGLVQTVYNGQPTQIAPGYGQPNYGQSNYGQPTYGQPTGGNHPGTACRGSRS